MHHKKPSIIAILVSLAGLAAASGQALSQVKVAAQSPPNSCEKVVNDYLATVRYVRQTSGAGIASRVEQTYLNEAEVVHLASQQGHCSAAAALRSKGAVR